MFAVISEEQKNQSQAPSNHILNDKNSAPVENSSQSPVCNLLPEFEKASLNVASGTVEDPEKACLAPSVPWREGLDLGDGSFWRTWERSQGKRQAEELSNPSSEEYLTADEGSDSEGPDGPRDGPRDGGNRRRDSGSSSESYKSTEGDTAEDTILMTVTPTRRRQELFMDG